MSTSMLRERMVLGGVGGEHTRGGVERREVIEAATS